jgi:tRNA splicing ligase
METVYRLEYKKYFKDGEKTQHIKISKGKQKLFNWVEEFCKQQELTLEKSTDPNHEFLFIDGDWVYYGKSDYLTIEFSCYATELF